jgi:recombination protein RecA
MSLTALKEQLAEVLEPARPGTPPLAIGIGVLDAALPGGGVPRGRLTEVLGRRGSGKTTLVRRLVESVVRAGFCVAYIDASRTLAAGDWCGTGRRAEGRGQRAEGGGQRDVRSRPGWGATCPDNLSRLALCPLPSALRPLPSALRPLHIIRPPTPTRASWCADVLLRSGAFALVVIDGAPPISRSVAVRLTRLARDGDAALVVVGDVAEGERGARPTMLGGALRLRVEGHRTRGRHRRERPWTGDRESGERAFVVAVEKGGHQRNVEVSCAIGVARRLCTHSEVPDRRGVAQRSPWGCAGGNAATVPASAVAKRAHARRCAEPDFGRSPSRVLPNGEGTPASCSLRATIARIAP